MEEYKSNSHKSKDGQTEKPPAKKVEKVVTGEVKSRKKSGIQKFAEALISEDAGNVRSYILTEALIPGAKKLISDIVKSGVDMILYGEAQHNNRNSNASKVSYRNYYDDGRNDRRAQGNSNRTRNGYSYDDIILSSRGEAEEVLSQMDDLIDEYGTVSVGDLYDLVGITGNYTDNKYGWKNIRNAEAVRIRDGYLLKLPKAMPLD